MEFKTNDLILRTVTENDIEEIARTKCDNRLVRIRRRSRNRKNRKYRNQGYASQCAMELINYAFEEMQYEIIYGGCAKSNVESYRVMQKVGMVQNSFYENALAFRNSLFYKAFKI